MSVKRCTIKSEFISKSCTDERKKICMKSITKKLLVGTLLMVFWTFLLVEFTGAISDECYCEFVPCQHGGSSEDFVPVETLTIKWDIEVSKKIDLHDGDISDWIKAGYKPVHITRDNMVNWLQGEISADWKMDVYFASDEENLYVAFDIADCDFVYGILCSFGNYYFYETE